MVEVEILWWYWVVFGILLMLAEILIPSFTIFWFGLAAVLTGGVLFLYPDISQASQLGWFAVLSCFWTILWFKVLGPRLHRIDPQKMKEMAIGETGIASKGNAHGRGVAMFSSPVMGEVEWPFESEVEINAGERIRIVDVVDIVDEDQGAKAVFILKVEKLG